MDLYVKAKSEAFSCFLHFKTMAELQLGTKLKAIQTE